MYCTTTKGSVAGPNTSSSSKMLKSQSSKCGAGFPSFPGAYAFNNAKTCGSCGPFDTDSVIGTADIATESTVCGKSAPSVLLNEEGGRSKLAVRAAASIFCAVTAMHDSVSGQSAALLVLLLRQLIGRWDCKEKVERRARFPGDSIRSKWSSRVNSETYSENSESSKSRFALLIWPMSEKDCPLILSTSYSLVLPKLHPSPAIVGLEGIVFCPIRALGPEFLRP
mmetsp:Transcript_43419/g.107328  ORF Transcript_43419/g.107328 Transcript_43419/m.107328 type:complete len:224 (+) Transcript_43419:2506-3177(+)